MSTPSKNTASPKKSYEVPAIIKLSLKFLEFLAPPLANRFAIKIFFTPLSFRRPKREDDILSKARIHKMNTGSNPFVGYEWGSGGPKVILVHGWSGRGTQFFKLIEELLKGGFHVFAIDAPAHGESKQKQTNMLEFVEAIEKMSSKFGAFDFGIGHSLGGMALMNSLDRGLPFKKIVTVGTPTSIPAVIDDFCEKVEASAKVGQAIDAYIESRFGRPTTTFSTDYLAQRHQPAGLIIHDTEDTDVPVRHAEGLSSIWTNARLIITNGLGHRKVLMDETVVREISLFLSTLVVA